MTLTNLHNTDAHGNAYFNGFTATNDNSNPVSNVLPWLTSTQLTTLCTSALGSTNLFSTNTNELFFRLVNDPNISGNVSGTANARYRFRYSAPMENWNITNTYNLVGPSYNITMPSANMNSAFNPSIRAVYLTMNSQALCMYFAQSQLDRFNTLNATTRYAFTYMGNLKNGAFTTNEQYARNLSFMYITNVGTSVALRVTSEVTNTFTNYAIGGAIGNHPITCSTTTPGANITDLVLREEVGSNLAVGICHNVLRASGALTLGQIYRVPTDPDGNTSQNNWLAVAPWGTDTLLMRVFTEGLT